MQRLRHKATALIGQFTSLKIACNRGCKQSASSKLHAQAQAAESLGGRPAAPSSAGGGVSDTSVAGSVSSRLAPWGASRAATHHITYDREKHATGVRYAAMQRGSLAMMQAFQGAAWAQDVCKARSAEVHSAGRGNNAQQPLARTLCSSGQHGGHGAGVLAARASVLASAVDGFEQAALARLAGRAGRLVESAAGIQRPCMRLAVSTPRKRSVAQPRLACSA